MPELVNSLCGYGAMPPMAGMPLQVTQPSNTTQCLPSSGSLPDDSSLPKVVPEKDPGKCFADDLPRCDTDNGCLCLA